MCCTSLCCNAEFKIWYVASWPFFCFQSSKMWYPLSLSSSYLCFISCSFASLTPKRRPSFIHFSAISLLNSSNSSFVGVPCFTKERNKFCYWGLVNEISRSHLKKQTFPTKFDCANQCSGPPQAKMINNLEIKSYWSDLSNWPQ